MEIGKRGKRGGHLHPRERRKEPPVPERATPERGEKKARSAKNLPYGFKYETRNVWSWTKPLAERPWTWEFHTPWYATSRQRDQAMRAFHWHKRNPESYRAPVPCKRGPDGVEIPEDG